MEKTVIKQPSDCCRPQKACECDSGMIFPVLSDHPVDDQPCCGPPAGPASSPFERAGYKLCRFVDEFIDTAAGPVPRVKTRLEPFDHLITLLARTGIMRNRYRVAPGLYAVGNPDADAPVLVTANYRLSFNVLRKELAGLSAWILVLDTRGINVWCAAGKGTFGTHEIVRQVTRNGLDRVVTHRRLILPQLSATGVSAGDVRKECGFTVVWGPIRVKDIKPFITSDMKADTAMRQVTFTLAERLVLVPVEVTMLYKPTLWILLAMFVLSGIGPHIFSFGDALERGWAACIAYGTGIFAGAIAVPILLPWIPGRAFSIKGAVTGLLAGIPVIRILSGITEPLTAVALLLLATAVSSYLATNFTGATPYTSPSGVEKEMRKAIPLQAAAVLIAAVLWVTSAFLRSGV